MNGNLSVSDPVGVSFWIISMAMVASTAFFFLERDRVSGKWKTSLTVAGLVTLIAAVHYYYMRDVWVGSGESPTVFRYIDWLLTVPLQMVEFYLILAAITAVSGGVFWRLFIGSVIMLLGGFLGEAEYIHAMLGFVIGMLGWAYILWEVFKGEAAQVNAASANASCQKAFGAMKMIVSVGPPNLARIACCNCSQTLGAPKKNVGRVRCMSRPKNSNPSLKLTGAP